MRTLSDRMFMGTRIVMVVAAMLVTTSASAQQQYSASGAARVNSDYTIGAQDVLIITSYDQRDLDGKFAVEADGTFTFPMLGRVAVGGKTLREAEVVLSEGLVERGLFKNPQIAVAVERYRSQKIFILGEVGKPGVYALSGSMSLIEALALADSTLPTARGEAVIVPAAAPSTDRTSEVVKVDLRALENGAFADNVQINAGDTIFIPRAENVYVFGQVKTPGAYFVQKDMTVLQALSLAGGVTERGAIGRVQIMRVVNGKQQELKPELADVIAPGDTVVVPERFF